MRYADIPWPADGNVIRRAYLQPGGRAVVQFRRDLTEYPGAVELTQAQFEAYVPAPTPPEVPAWQVELAAALLLPESTQGQQIAKTLALTKALSGKELV